MRESSDIAIHVANLSKEFKIYSHPSDMFREMISGKLHHKSFWALKDISFDVQRGSVVGLLGRNGAGKSTLLKIITGTLDKTSGEVETYGRISSILELGTGFNGEYTGRENIYFGGLMVGLSHDEIKAKEDWIIEFSELRDFIDQPFKTYSSGMQARLTFSTAVCVDPDILIIDEALSVGDARFGKKSFNKIREFQQAGHTILLVSHNINSINDICTHAILLEGGKVLETGLPNTVTKHYWEMMFVDQEEGRKSPDNLKPVAPLDAAQAVHEPSDQLAQTKKDYSGLVRAGDRLDAEIIDTGILDSQGRRVNYLESGQNYSIFIKALFHKDTDTDIGFGFHITNEKGATLFGISANKDSGMIFPPQKKNGVLEARLNVTMWLTNGNYLLGVGVGRGEKVFDYLYDVLLFTIPNMPYIHHASVVNLEPNFEYREHRLPDSQG